MANIHKEERLKGVHPSLVEVVRKAAEHCTVDFEVREGVRSLSTQKRYVEQGVSKTLKSKHLPQIDGYGHAVDLYPVVDGKVFTVDWDPTFADIAYGMKEAAKELGIEIIWGGDWKSFKDGPHYELV